MSSQSRIEAIAIGLAVFMFVTGTLFGIFRFHTRTAVHIKKVERSWGKPTQSIDGTQVNPNLVGFTCDIYQARSTIVCHK